MLFQNFQILNGFATRLLKSFDCLYLTGVDVINISESYKQKSVASVLFNAILCSISVLLYVKQFHDRVRLEPAKT